MLIGIVLMLMEGIISMGWERVVSAVSIQGVGQGVNALAQPKRCPVSGLDWADKGGLKPGGNHSLAGQAAAQFLFVVEALEKQAQVQLLAHGSAGQNLFMRHR